jgi:MFS family permease
MYELSTAFPQMDSYYGFLSGFAYTVPYSIFGLFSGYLTKSKQRNLMLCMIMIMTSCFHLTAGATTSFGVLCAMRILHGALSSATNPLSYSLVADYYPPEKRGTPNAILSTGNFVGIALSSISILLIKSFGWRTTYAIMGIVGIVPAVMGLFLINDPRKDK